MRLTFSVPRETTTRFVVTVDRAPADAASAVPWRVPRPHRRQAAAALGTPRLTITCRPPSLVIVSSTASPSCQPRAALVARAAARAVAEAYGGVVEDVLTGRVFAPAADDGEEPSTFRLTPDWLGWRIGPGARARGPAAAEPATPVPAGPGSPGAAPAWSVRTRGLCRFGLPELMLEPPGCARARHPFDLLHAVAERLLDEHLAWLSANPGGGVRRMCDHLRIDPGDLPALCGASARLAHRPGPAAVRPVASGPPPIPWTGGRAEPGLADAAAHGGPARASGGFRAEPSACGDATTAATTGAAIPAASGSPARCTRGGPPPNANRSVLLRLSLVRLPAEDAEDPLREASPAPEMAPGTGPETEPGRWRGAMTSGVDSAPEHGPWPGEHREERAAAACGPETCRTPRTRWPGARSSDVARPCGEPSCDEVPWNAWHEAPWPPRCAMPDVARTRAASWNARPVPLTRPERPRGERWEPEDRRAPGSGTAVIRIGPPLGCDGDPGGASRLACPEALPYRHRVRGRAA